MTLQTFLPADSISKQIGLRCRELGINLDFPSATEKPEVYTVNIVAVEGAEVVAGKLVANADAPDLFNDTLVLLACHADRTVKRLATFRCTTEPGRYYTLNPLNPAGAARLAIDYKHQGLWKLGYHKSQPTETLVQRGIVRVFRDLNKDGVRTGDKVFTGAGFGINFHTTSRGATTIGQWSAGCVVIPEPDQHRRAMAIIKQGLPLSRNRGASCSLILLDGSKLPSAS